MCAAPTRDKIAIIHTRPESVATAIAAMGFMPLICPVLDVIQLNPVIPDADIYIVSSVHAVSFVPQDARVITVGRQTELAAQAAGLQCVQPFAQNAAVLMSYEWDGQAVHIGGAHLAP